MDVNKLQFAALLFLFYFITTNIYTQDNKNIYFLTLEELMDARVITASKFSEEIKDVPASVVIVNREEIERLGFTTLTEILQNIPGLYMIDDYYWLGSVNFGVRGFFSTGAFNDMIILVNGVNQMSDKYSDYPDVKINVNVESIERIEVIRGPMSVIYGSGAFMGAINIITTSEEQDVPKSIVSVGYGNYGRTKLNFKHSNQNNNLNYSVDLSYDKTDGIDNQFSDLTTNLDILEYVGLSKNATLKGQMDNARKYFHVALGFDGFFTDFSYAETQKDVFDAQPNYYGGSQLTTNAANMVLGYKKSLSDIFTFITKFGYYSHSHTLDYNIFRPNYYEIDAQNTHSCDFEFDGFLTFSENFNIEFGLYRRTILDILQISDFGYYGLEYAQGEIGLPDNETYSNSAVFTQVDYSPIQKLKLIGGLRVEFLDDYKMEYARGLISEDPAANCPPDSTCLRRIYNATLSPENNGVLFIPRIAALYTLNDNHVLKFMFGKAIKQPSFTENYRQLPNNGPQLKAADISTFEINYLGNYFNTFNINASIFYNSINNLISTTNIFNQETKEWEIFSSNSGTLKTKGFELGLIIKPSDDIIINLSGVYQNSQNLKSGYENITLGYSPKYLGYFNASYLFSHEASIAVLGRYISETETQWKTNSTVENGSRIGNKIKSYTIIDVNFRYNNIFDTNLFCDLKIGNIFDSVVRYPTTTSNIWANKGTLGFGREILFSFGYKIM